MPKEYVYKIVIDDGDVDKTIDSVDQRVVALTQRMDSLFSRVGSAAGPGAQRASQQVEQATQRVQRAQQQATQATVRGEQQSMQARMQSLRSINAQIAQTEKLVQARQKAADSAKANLEQERRLLQGIEAERERAAGVSESIGAPRSRRRVTGRGTLQAVAARREEFFEGAISRGQERVAGRETAVGDAQAELEQMQQAHQSLVQSRQEVAAQITQAAQQQGQAETQAAQEAASAQTQAQEQVAQAAQSSADAQLQASRNAVQGARDVVKGKQEELAAAQATEAAAKAESDSARRNAQLKRRASQDAAEASRRAAEVAKAAAAEVANAEKEGNSEAIKAAKEKQAVADDAAKTRKEEAEAAKAAATEATRASQDAAQKAKAASGERVAASRALTAANKQQSATEKELRSSTSALAKEKRAAAKVERDAERSFIRTTKTFTRQRNELNLLARRHGSFNVTIGKTADEMNDLEREVNDVIRSDQQLSEEMDKIIAKSGKFNVAIGRETFAGGPQAGVPRGQFRQAGFAAQRLGVPGAAAFGEAAAVGGAAGVAVAGVLLSAQQLVKVFQRMASFAAEAFKTIVAGSVEAAKEIEVARAQFNAFFQQDTQAAEATLQRLQKLSLELGEDVVGIGRAFLPEVESLDQLEEVTKIAVALARFQPEQGITGARISLQEALGGEFRSLQRRFEISPIAIDQIREAFQTSGVTGLLEELQAELERTGRSAEDLGNTFGVAVGRIRERFRQLRQDLGEPIIEQVKEELEGIDEELERLDPDLTAVAQGFGDVVAHLTDLVGAEVEEFLEEFDPQSLFDIIEALFAAVDAFGVFLTGLNAGEGAAEGMEGALDGIGGALLRVEGFFLNAALSVARYREQMADTLPLIIFFNDLLQRGVDVSDFILAGPDGVPGVDAIQEALEVVFAAQEGFLSVGSSVEETLSAIEAHNQKTEDFANGLLEYASASGDAVGAGEEQANTFLKVAAATEQLILLQRQYAEAQGEVNEVVKEFNISAQLKFEKILLDAQRARLDFEIEAAQKTLDIERKNARKIADIRRSFDLAIIDAAQTLADLEADIIRNHGRAVLDLEDDLNNKRLDAEQDYQDNLQRIRDRFNFQAFEAMLANDAKQLRQIRRRQAFEEQQAAKDRDRNIRDIDIEIDRRREKLDRALARELEDARINNARKLRDLAQNLDEQLVKQQEARRRDLEDQAIAERRKRAEFETSLARQLDDYNTWWEERNRVTAEKIQDDLDLMREYVQSAADILNELHTLGVVVNPTTGQLEIGMSVLEIDPLTSAIRGIQERVAALIAQEEQLSGTSRTPAAILEGVQELDVTELVAELDRLQDVLQTQELDPNAFVDTTDLAKNLLLDQALKIGKQAGLSAQTVIDETLGLSMPKLQKWIDDFIDKYAVHDLPEFSLFGFTPEQLEGGGLNLPGAIPGQMSVPGTGGIEGQPLAPFSAVPGQTPFIFPNVTDAPFVTPTEGAVGQFAPPFGQALGLGGGVSGDPFAPAAVLPTSPAAGFDPAHFQAQLDAQVAAQVTAELLKRGEIEDTIAFAELQIEKYLLAVTAGLDEETAKYQASQDANIAILELTLARQQEALEQLRQDPALAEEAEAVEESIRILEEALERQREQAAQANEQRIEGEAETLENAEEDKQRAIEGTLTAAERAAIDKANAILRGLDEETAGTLTAAGEQTQIVRDQEVEEGEIRDEGRAAELEAEQEHSQDRLDTLGDGFQGEADLLGDFWTEWLRFEQQGITQDLRLLVQWIRQRQLLIRQATIGGPGGGTLPGVGGPEGQGGGGQATIQQLQALATSHADELGILTPELASQIAQMAYEELVSFIDYLQQQLGGRALGGSIQPGQMMRVGELGEEIVRFPGTTMVDPIRSLLFRTPPPVSAGGVTNIDRSTNMGGFNFPDPRGLPPTYIKMMEGIAANIIRDSWAGR